MRVLRTIGRWLRARPGTVTLALLVLALSIVLEIVSGGHHVRMLDAVGLGAAQLVDEGRWWTPVTYTLFAVGPRSIVLSVVAILVLCGLVEPRLGWRRLAVAWVVSSIVGGIASAFLLEVLDDVAWDWFTTGDELTFAAPWAAAVGVAFAGSAALGEVSRRRLRVLLTLVVVLVVVAVGQPSDIAAALSGVVGFVVGIIAMRRVGRPQWRRSDAYEIRVLLAGGLAALGIAPMIALWQPNRHTLVKPLADALGAVIGELGAVQHCSIGASGLCRGASPVAGLTPLELGLSMLPWLAFLVAAWGVWRGMRVAAWIGVVLTSLVVVLVAYYWFLAPLDAATQGVAPPRADASEHFAQIVVVILIFAAAAFCLWFFRRSCPRLPQRRRIVGPIVVVLAAQVVLMAGYVGFVMADTTAWDPEPSLAQAIADAPERLMPVALLIATPEAILPTTPLAATVYWSIAPLFNLVILWAVFRMVAVGRSVRRDLPRERVDAALRRGGGTTLSYMATWPRIHHWVDEATGALVPYRFERGVAIVLGVPFGAPDAPPVDVIARFARAADEHGWIPTVYAAPGELEPDFAAIGWRCIEVGEESVIHPAAWSMQGKKWQNVRTSINRAKREGVEVRWTTYRELTVAQAHELRDMSVEWAGEKDLPEMGFTLGGLDELDDPDVRLALAVHEDGRIEAATSWLPTWRDERIVGWTLDFMRRRPDGMNGVMEMLIASVAERLQDEGVELMSLSAAPLASTVSHATDGDQDATRLNTIDTLLAYLSARLEPVYGFRSLLRFKQKFQPEMRSLVLAYGDPVHLPAIGLALTEAYLPGVTLGQLAASLRQARKEPEGV